MKRAVILLWVLALAMCAVTPVCADNSGEFTIPEALMKVAARAEDVKAPDALPEPIDIVSFTLDDNGVITVELAGEVPSLKITEIQHEGGKESTIFSKKNTAAGQTNRTGGEESTFNVLLTWDLDGIPFRQVYSIWDGWPSFEQATATEKVKDFTFENWEKAERVLYYRDDGTLLSENWNLRNGDDALTRVARYDEEGKLEGCEVCWAPADYDGEIPRGQMLKAEIDSSGALSKLQYRNRKSGFTIRSIALSSRQEQLNEFYWNSGDSYLFEESMNASYPGLIRRFTDQEEDDTFFDGDDPFFDEDMTYTDADQPATPTDLAATRTDLPGIGDYEPEEYDSGDGEPEEYTDESRDGDGWDEDGWDEDGGSASSSAGAEDEEEEEAEKKAEIPEVAGVTENTRVWDFAFGEVDDGMYYEDKVYVYASDDPLLLIADGTAETNAGAADINGRKVNFRGMPDMDLPAFGLPVIE